MKTEPNYTPAPATDDALVNEVARALYRVVAGPGACWTPLVNRWGDKERQAVRAILPIIAREKAAAYKAGQEDMRKRLNKSTETWPTTRNGAVSGILVTRHTPPTTGGPHD